MNDTKKVSEMLGKEVFATYDYYGLIMAGEVEHSCPIVIYVPKSVAENAKTPEDVLPFYKFPEMIRGMNLGFDPEETRILWGNFFPKCKVPGQESKVFPGFVLSDIGDADNMLILASKKSLTEQTLSRPGILNSYQEYRSEMSMFCSCGEEHEPEIDDQEIIYVFKIGCANIAPNPEMDGAVDVNDEDEIFNRAEDWIALFKTKQKEAAEEVASEQEWQTSITTQFEEVVVDMLKTYGDVSSQVSQSFWSRYYPNSADHTFEHLDVGSAKFLGTVYDVNRRPVALPELMGEFTTFERNWAEYWQRSLGYDMYRGILQKLPVRVKDCFGKFYHRKTPKPIYARHLEVRIGFEFLELIYNGRLIGVYDCLGVNFDCFLEDIKMLLKRHFALRLDLWLYQRQ